MHKASASFLFILMATHKLENYVRTYRRRSALSQDEVAYLLGCKDGGKISRYERFKREPHLETALAYEIIFNIPVRELFAGLFEKIEKQVVCRIGSLGRKLSSQKPGRLKEQKLEALAAALRGIRNPEERP